MLRTATRITTAIAGIGSVAGGALLAMHGATTLAASPTATSVPTASTAAPARVCDDGTWRVQDANVQGRPDHFDRGDRGATYLWHDSDGWHLRTTDGKNVENDYTGTIELSRGATFTGVRPVMLEKDDRVSVDGNNILHYSFSTYNGIDGFDFRVSACDGARAADHMTFHLMRNGSDDSTRRIDLGDMKQHPESATFTTVRTL